MVQPLSCSRPCGCPPQVGPPCWCPWSWWMGDVPPDGHPHPDAEHLPVPARWQPALLPAPPRCPCPPGLSTAALLAILGCGTSLLGRGARKHHQLRRRGGGEADTQAFDMAALQHPPAPGLLPGPPHNSLQVYGYDGGGHVLRQPQPPGLLLGGQRGGGGRPW
ncbi:unnamed protein product [Eretmochelys imbricata]